MENHLFWNAYDREWKNNAEKIGHKFFENRDYIIEVEQRGKDSFIVYFRKKVAREAVRIKDSPRIYKTEHLLEFMNDNSFYPAKNKITWGKA